MADQEETAVFLDDGFRKFISMFWENRGAKLEFPNPTLYIPTENSDNSEVAYYPTSSASGGTEYFLYTMYIDSYKIHAQIDSDMDDVMVYWSGDSNTHRDEPGSDSLYRKLRTECYTENKCLNYYSSERILQEGELEEAIKNCGGSFQKQECRALYFLLEGFDIKGGVQIGRGAPSSCDTTPCSQPGCFGVPRSELSNQAAREMANCRISKKIMHLGKQDIDNDSGIRFVSDNNTVEEAEIPYLPVNITGIIGSIGVLLTFLLVRCTDLEKLILNR